MTGVITQGKSSKNQWITKYYLAYSNDAYKWNYVLDEHNYIKVSLPNFEFVKLVNNKKHL